MSTSREEMILCKHSHSSESLTSKKYQHCPAVSYNIAMISKSRQFFKSTVENALNRSQSISSCI